MMAGFIVPSTFRLRIVFDAPFRVHFGAGLTVSCRGQTRERSVQDVGHVDEQLVTCVGQRSSGRHLLGAVAGLAEAEHVAGLEVAVVFPQFECFLSGADHVEGLRIGLEFVKDWFAGWH